MSGVTSGAALLTIPPGTTRANITTVPGGYAIAKPFLPQVGMTIYLMDPASPKNIAMGKISEIDTSPLSLKPLKFMNSYTIVKTTSPIPRNFFGNTAMPVSAFIDTKSRGGRRSRRASRRGSRRGRKATRRR